MIDRDVINHVVWVLAAALIILVSGMVYSSITGKTIDTGVSTLAAAMGGYLGSMVSRRAPIDSTSSTSANGGENKTTTKGNNP